MWATRYARLVCAVDDADSRGAVEKFIAAFDKLEADLGLFGLRDDADVAWWDAVRYRVRFELAVEAGVYGRRTGSATSVLRRLGSLAGPIRRLLRDVVTLRGSEATAARVMFVSTRPDINMQRLVQAEEAQGGVIVISNAAGKSSSSVIALSRRSVEAAVRVVARFQPLPQQVEFDARRSAAAVQARFGSAVDIFPLVADKYREHRAARYIWSFILHRAAAVERIVYINDDALKSLVVVARGRGIATEELQHGYMGSSHIAFSYPRLEEPLETLPDRLLSTRDTGDIVYPVERVPVRAPITTDADGIRDTDVLVGASPTFAVQTMAIVDALVAAGVRVAVKLHPAQTVSDSGLRDRYSEGELVILDGGQDFDAVARRSRVFVPANPTSTTTFEAVECGARLVVVDYGGVKVTSMNDELASARVDSAEQLPAVVVRLLAL